MNAALAYRPFDSTDADVAPAGEAEIELGPLHYLREGSSRFVHLPAVVANFGLAGERELVIEGRHEVALDPEPGQPRSALVDSAVSMKQVLRRGVLQDEPGPSVAAEYGVLLPSTDGGGTGFSVAGIVSQRGSAGSVHLNGALMQTREHEPGVFLGTIVEGPFAWPVRPVAEIFTQRISETARTDSLLVGAIWRAREGLSFDVGVRSARVGDEAVHEVRLGLTFAFPIGNKEATP
ncbi:MAG TPA: hypothetical protein VNU64_11075 [Burkholderiales bacterium]|nr:hypothetical protein [Burkholderiales bacterium]